MIVNFFFLNKGTESILYMTSLNIDYLIVLFFFRILDYLIFEYSIEGKTDLNLIQFGLGLSALT